MGRALVALLAGIQVAIAWPALAADSPPAPLAQSGELRLDGDGTLRLGGRVLVHMAVAGSSPEAGSIRPVPGNADAFEVTTRKGTRGRTVIVAGEGDQRLVVVDEATGPSA